LTLYTLGMHGSAVRGSNPFARPFLIF